jgi:hypothetical protein
MSMRSTIVSGAERSFVKMRANLLPSDLCRQATRERSSPPRVVSSVRNRPRRDFCEFPVNRSTQFPASEFNSAP